MLNDVSKHKLHLRSNGSFPCEAVSLIETIIEDSQKIEARLHACCWNAPAWFCVGNEKSRRSIEVYLFEFICVSLSGRGYWRRARCAVCVAHWVDSLLSSCRASCARNCLPEGLPPELRYEQFVSETSANIKVSSDRYSEVSEECKPLPTEQTCQKTFFSSHHYRQKTLRLMERWKR